MLFVLFGLCRVVLLCVVLVSFARVVFFVSCCVALLISFCLDCLIWFGVMFGLV